MKQKDIALIVVVAIVAGFISFFVSRIIFVSADQSKQEVETAPAISTTFTPPNAQYFNANSFNPTQTIEIGNSANPLPFEGAE